VLEFQPLLHVVSSPVARLGRADGARDEGDVTPVASAHAARVDAAKVSRARVSLRADMSSSPEE
jgi:hypothetical protein